MIQIFSGDLLVNGHECSISKKDDKKFADCARISLRTSQGRLYRPIPSDLDQDIAYLDYSSNAIPELTTRSFERYGDLIMLSLYDSTVDKIEGDALTPLTKLEELDLGATRIFTGSISVWPPRIKKLYYNKIQRNEVNLADLAELEFADVRDNRLKKFPTFNMKAPLHTVWLDGNLMDDLNVAQIAPYCHLTNLSMKLLESSEFLMPHKFCDCFRVKLWAKQFNILVEDIECREKEGGEECDKEFGDDIMTLRRNCVGEEIRRSGSYSFVMIGFIIFFIFLTLILLAFAFLYTIKRRKSAESGSSFDSSSSGGRKDEDEDDNQNVDGPEEEETVE